MANNITQQVRDVKPVLLQCWATVCNASPTFHLKQHQFNVLYFMCIQHGFPANTKHLYNICTTSAQRLRRWSNIVQMVYKCFVFAGFILTCPPAVDSCLPRSY